MKKTIVKGMNLAELEEWVLQLGEKKFRARQIYEGLYKHRYETWQEFTNLSLALREKLQEYASIPKIEVTRHLKSELDATQKFTFEVAEGKEVEAVWIPSADGERKTICISSQVGCTLACAFCATGKLDFQGNLKAWQILDQVIQVEKLVGESASNIVFMGMGEPMHNYFAVLKTAHLLHDEDTFTFAARKITISTAGDVKGIRRFVENREPFNFAISLNHPDANKRADVMDIDKKYPLQELLAAAKDFTKTLGRKVTFEYVMIPDVNMSQEDAAKLVKLANSLNCKINLIPLNTDFYGWERPTEEQIAAFRQAISKAKVPVMNRRSPGKDINGACGMLSLKGKPNTPRTNYAR
ncbi:MAG: 23S rRNA (adenine(2503)-C(2))-methyltransferase RlmN [Spirochaetota bacterium]